MDKKLKLTKINLASMDINDVSNKNVINRHIVYDRANEYDRAIVYDRVSDSKIDLNNFIIFSLDHLKTVTSVVAFASFVLPKAHRSLSRLFDTISAKRAIFSPPPLLFGC
jgi:predicted site-specific integrase-resolvase